MLIVGCILQAPEIHWALDWICCWLLIVMVCIVLLSVGRKGRIYYDWSMIIMLVARQVHV